MDRNDLKNIALNIVATIICGATVWCWRMFRHKHSPQQLRSTNSNPPQGVAEDTQHLREHNRARFEETFFGLFFYVLTFWSLYWSIISPALFKNFGTKPNLLLSQARFIGELLPNIPVEGTIFQGAFLVAAFCLYIPILSIAQFVAKGPIVILNHYFDMNTRNRMRVELIVFMVLCLPIAAASVFLFYEMTYSQAIERVVIFLAIAGVVFGAGSGRR